MEVVLLAPSDACQSSSAWWIHEPGEVDRTVHQILKGRVDGFVDPRTGLCRSGCHSFQKETEEATAKRPRAPGCPGPSIGDVGRVVVGSSGSGRTPGTEETLRPLRDPARRLPRPREVLPDYLREIRHGSLFKLNEDSFTKNIRSTKRGVAPGPSGMTFDHLRPILDSPRDTHALLAEIMARAQIPADIIGAVRVGRMMAFRKRTGGVRGIVAGDALRRLIARTIAQQMDAGRVRVCGSHCSL